MKWKLSGRLLLRDGWIVLLGMSLQQYESVLITPNASHSIFPLSLVLLMANVWMSENVLLRYLVAGCGAFVLAFTGFGLFGAVTMAGILAWTTVQHVRRGERFHSWIAGVASVVAIAGLLAFLADFFAISEFDRPWAGIGNYVRFIVLMLLGPSGLRGTGTMYLLLGGVLGTTLLLTIVPLLWSWICSRDRDPARDVLILLLGTGTLFVVAASMGRISGGDGGGFASRYQPLMLLLWLAVYLASIRVGRPALNKTVTALVWLLTLPTYGAVLSRPLSAWPGTTGADERQLRDYWEHGLAKQAWVDHYLKTGEVNGAEAMSLAQVHPSPESTQLEAKLSFLRSRHLSFFQDQQKGTSYLPWVNDLVVVWNQMLPAYNQPHHVTHRAELTMVVRQPGFAVIPVSLSLGMINEGMEVIVEDLNQTPIAVQVGSGVISVPVDEGFNRLVLTCRLGDGPPREAGTAIVGPVRLSSAPMQH